MQTESLQFEFIFLYEQTRSGWLVSLVRADQGCSWAVLQTKLATGLRPGRAMATSVLDVAS